MSSDYSSVLCNICNEVVRVTDTQNGVSYDEYYLACGHIQKIDKQAVMKNNNKDLDIDTKKKMVESNIRKDQSTCSICGLTSRSSEELEEHKYHAHSGDGNSSKRSSEQDIDPFPGEAKTD